MNSKKIFFSYAWGDDQESGESREKIVDDLYASLAQDGFDVVRDKNDLGYRGFISDFMKKIGEGDTIVVAISQKYVKSPYCMFELYEIARNSNFDKYKFQEKVLPIMVEFIDFSRPKVLDEHFSYWEETYNEWDGLVKKRTGQLSNEQLQRYDKIKMIHQNFGKLSDWLVDMNTLSPRLLSADNFAEIKKAIIGKDGNTQGPRTVEKPAPLLPGREAEQTRLSDFLESGHTVLPFYGVGGMGKTYTVNHWRHHNPRVKDYTFKDIILNDTLDDLERFAFHVLDRSDTDLEEIKKAVVRSFDGKPVLLRFQNFEEALRLTPESPAHKIKNEPFSSTLSN